MRILVTNDDGVYAPGLTALAKAMSALGDVTVVAPDRNRSGVSNSLTLHRPLRAKKIENGFYSVEGTPTDCVHLALSGLINKKFDIVVSGINAGSNLGDDVIYSGTVAAATEGRFLGLPAIAISLNGNELVYYETAGQVIKNLIHQMTNMVLPANTILNVNVPDVPFESLGGYEVTRLGTRHSAEPTIEQIDPRGHQVYWIGPPGLEQDAGPGTDFCAVRNNRVSITPLHLDWTDHQLMPTIDAWLKNWHSELNRE